MDPQTQIIVTAIISALSSSGLMSLIIFLIQRKDRKKETQEKKTSAETRILIGLGHDKITYLTDVYIKRGAITLKEKRNLEFLAQPYFEAGGNGDGKIGYEECQKLPVVSEYEAESMNVIIKRREYGLDVE